MHQRLSFELHRGGIMVMTIGVVMQWRAIGMLIVGLLAPGIAIAAMSVVRCLEIARHRPDMLNRPMKDQEKESNLNYKRTRFHDNPTITFTETKGQSHAVGTSQRLMGETANCSDIEIRRNTRRYVV